MKYSDVGRHKNDIVVVRGSQVDLKLDSDYVALLKMFGLNTSYMVRFLNLCDDDRYSKQLRFSTCQCRMFNNRGRYR